MSEPYQSPPGFHRHRCPECGCVWEHEDEGRPLHHPAGTHNCPAPGCQNFELFRYNGDSPPEYTTRDRSPR